MPGSDRDPRESARQGLARTIPAGPASRLLEQRRVIELLRHRPRKSVVEDSLAELRRRVQELERENARLRRGPQGGAV